MARVARIYSESGIYHVILRGINRQKIFAHDEEKEKFVSILQRYFAGDDIPPQKRKNYQGRLFAFCILDNHIHLLMEESKLGISNLMQRISTAYAIFFNRRHGRSGPVFESRYTSRAVEGNRYFTNALKYIHNNPVAAGIVKKASAYAWSSMTMYISGCVKFLAQKFVLCNFDSSKFEPAVKSPYSKDDLLECSWPERVSDFTVLKIFNNLCRKYNIKKMDIGDNITLQKVLVEKLYKIKGITKVQISRVLNFTLYKLSKIISMLHNG